MTWHCGATRAVLLWGPFALKFPRPMTVPSFLCGQLANVQEREFSRLQHPALCPVLWAAPLGLLLVMRRARPLQLSEFDALPNDFGGALRTMLELKIENLGQLNGRVVAVDYGN